MTGSRRRTAAWLNALIVLVTIILAIMLLSWSDSEFLRVEGPVVNRGPHVVLRPEWVFSLEVPYRRLAHDFTSFCVAATLGAGALLAVEPRTWTRRGMSRRGTIVVGVILLVGGITIVHQLLIASAPVRPNGLCYVLRNALQYRVPGAFVAAWAVTLLRPNRIRMDLRERLARAVGWLWITDWGFMIGYGVIFG